MGDGMRLRVVSDGVAMKVYDADSNRQLEGVVSVDVAHRRGELPHARIVVEDVEISIVADGTVETESERHVGGDRPPVRPPRPG